MPLAIEPPTPAASCVIWLHGLGADSSDFCSIIPELNLPATHHTRFIFPDAPLRQITVNGGMQMRGWYDIVNFDFHQQQDHLGIKASSAALWQLITAQINAGIASEKIMLAGFSQGAAMSLYAGLCCPDKLAGIVALSGYLPIADDFAQQARVVNLSTKIFQAHGLYDPVVPLHFGQESYALLRKLAYDVNFKTYAMEHTLCLPEIDDIARFIKEVFAYA